MTVFEDMLLSAQRMKNSSLYILWYRAKSISDFHVLDVTVFLAHFEFCIEVSSCFVLICFF